MELRRAADAILRSQSTPLAILLKPSPPTRWTTARQLNSLTSSRPSTYRAISSTTRRYAAPPAIKTTTPPQSTEGSPTSPASNPPQDNTIESLTASMNWAKPPPRNPDSRIPPPLGSRLPRGFDPSSPPGRRSDKIGVDAHAILAKLNQTRTQHLRPPASRFPYSPSSSSNGGDPFSQMLIPTPPTSSTTTPSLHDLTKSISVESSLRLQKGKDRNMPLNPSTGRYIKIDSRVELARGVRLLEQSCARNKVRADAQSQKYHEREGTKRKRLRRVRWRKRFLDGFKAAVGRVRELRRQGW